MSELELCSVPARNRHSAVGRSLDSYYAYIPDTLCDRAFQFDDHVRASLAEAEEAIRRFDSAASVLALPGLPARLLLRAEAESSSDGERFCVSPKRLLIANHAREKGVDSDDAVARAILEDVEAIDRVLLEAPASITVERLCDLHRELLAGGSLAHRAGRIRRKQNAIKRGKGARFFPPPPNKLPALLDDLIRFCNDEKLSAVAQAALAHAQLLTLHPFPDGNGRVARALTFLMLRNRGLLRSAVLPLRTAWAPAHALYIKHLIGMAYVGSPLEPAARKAIDDWVCFFAATCTRAAKYAEAFELRISQMNARWRARLGDTSTGSDAATMVSILPRCPIFSIDQAVGILQASRNAAHAAIEVLVNAGILEPISGRRSGMFEAIEVTGALADFESPMRQRILIKASAREFDDANDL